FSSRTRVRRRAPAHQVALLHELGGAPLHSGGPPRGGGVWALSPAVPDGGDEGSDAVAARDPPRWSVVGPRSTLPADPRVGPVTGLTADQLALFTRGSGEFQRVFTPETGLGPLFNAVACAACHEEPLPGGGGANDPAEESEDIEVHATAFHPGAKCGNLEAVG